jgi:hypothetical protein
MKFLGYILSLLIPGFIPRLFRVVVGNTHTIAALLAASHLCMMDDWIIGKLSSNEVDSHDWIQVYSLAI